MKSLRRTMVIELLERAKLAKIIAARWERAPSPRDRVKASVIAQYVADVTGESKRQITLRSSYRRQIQRACELAGHKQRVHVHSVQWVVCIKERAP